MTAGAFAEAAGALVPEAQTVAFALICLFVGMWIPAGYAVERFQGFGRALVGKLAYAPPPGMDREEALKRAVRRGESVAKNDEREGDGGE